MSRTHAVVLWSLLAALALAPACGTTRATEPSLDGALRLARSELARGSPSTARSALLEVRHRVVGTPQHAEHALLLGEAQNELGLRRAAISSFFRCRTLAEGKDERLVWRASMGLAAAHRSMGRWEPAERHLREAAAFAPGERQRDRALVLLAQGSLDAGRPAHARAYLGLVHDRSELGYDEAEAALAGQRAGEGAVEVRFPTVLAPEIRLRASWRARAIDMAGDPRLMDPPYRVTVHHGADRQRPPTGLAEAVARIRSYQDLHQKTRGWADIAYHFVIDGAGRIWEGREMRWQGAHAGNDELNRGNIGVCLMGNFDRDEPTPPQKESLERLLSYLCEAHGISPRMIVGHGTIVRAIPNKSTACPGKNLKRFLVRLRPRLPW